MAYTSNQLAQIATSARTSNLNNIINSVTLSKTIIRQNAASVLVNVTGGVNSVFTAQVTRSSDGRYYNFTTKTFLEAVTTQSRLKNQSPGSFGLAIPAAAGGDVYTVIIMAEPHYGTRLSIGNGIRYATTITQLANSTTDFIVPVLVSIKTQKLAESTGSSLDNPRVVVELDDVQLDMTASSADHGFFLTTPNNSNDLNNGVWSSSALFWSTVAADHETTSASSHDTGATSTALVLNNVDGLHVGMHVSHIETIGALATMPTITAINVGTLTVTLSTVQTWADEKEITFRAYGPRLIKSAIGISISLENSTIRLGGTTTASRTAITSDITAGSTFNVKGTKGVGVGSTIRMRGLQKNASSSACTVAAVGGSILEGTITLANGTIGASAARPLRAGTIIYVDNSSSNIFLSGSIIITKYPVSNQSLQIDMSRMLTARTAS